MCNGVVGDPYEYQGKATVDDLLLASQFSQNAELQGVMELRIYGSKRSQVAFVWVHGLCD